MDKRAEGDETVNLTIGSLSSTLNGQVSIVDSTHTATIEDNEVGTINFQANQSNDESVSPTVKATLSISSTGSAAATSHTLSLHDALPISLSGTAGASDYSFTGTTLTFAA